ncbi:MAG: DUF1573 domain-containing protein, partial [Draconibacterium sp.]
MKNYCFKVIVSSSTHFGLPFFFDSNSNDLKLLQEYLVLWPARPIKPGGGGEIKIGYDTSRPGRFDKTISVFYNGNNSPAIFQIKGRVNYPGQAVNHRDDKNIKT